MASRDHYNQIANNIAEHMNAYRLAFKTYKLDDFDKMFQQVAGTGSRVSGTGDTSETFEKALLERGFMVFPPVAESKDGYVRVFRTNTVTSELLAAFRYPGTHSDSKLAQVLGKIKRRPMSDDFGGDDSAE